MSLAVPIASFGAIVEIVAEGRTDLSFELNCGDQAFIFDDQKVPLFRRTEKPWQFKALIREMSRFGRIRTQLQPVRQSR